MRAMFLLCACVLTACSTQTVRCERHLTPINVPRHPLTNALAPSQPEGSRAPLPSTTQSGGTPRTKAAAESVAPKRPGPAPSTDDRGSP